MILNNKNVDYDVIICIPSYNRYEKVNKLLNQFYTQKTKYTFSIVFLNDGSDDNNYDNLKNKYNRFTYLKNDKPNGKLYHWRCYNQMWNVVKTFKSHTILHMDDDFILADNFLDKLLDIYFSKKNENNNIMCIAPHSWSFIKKYNIIDHWWSDKYAIDGIALFDYNLIEEMNFSLQPVSNKVVNPGIPVGVWVQFSNFMKKNNYYLYRTNISYVFHDGNEDSKLHGDVRNKNKGVYSKRLDDSLLKYLKIYE